MREFYSDETHGMEDISGHGGGKVGPWSRVGWSALHRTSDSMKKVHNWIIDKQTMV